MSLNDKCLGKISTNKLKGESKTPAASKMEFFEKKLTNTTRTSIRDVTGVLDTTLKLVNTKSLKMNKTCNFKIKSTTEKTSKPIFRSVIF